MFNLEHEFNFDYYIIYNEDYNMFKAGSSARIHWYSAYKRFSKNLNFENTAAELNISVEVLSNKLAPVHSAELSVSELMAIGLSTGNTTLIDGTLAQLDCLPSVSLSAGR
ncbi:phage regulatory CII family protein [Sodalis ligni]|uniref:Phage regulatory protein CII n=1 Tax=Sodalis ligni TaxID=2697027 RepID=A0A4R1N912_9GAMM|nr:phage regulatory CII family protein [Sodalis ligni]TCL03692.1 phage regulatory protein CII [Sodalis ligni]